MAHNEDSTPPRRKEIYTYAADWPIYAMHWSIRPDYKFRIALGSFLEDFQNKVEVVQLNKEDGKFEKKGTLDHVYPATKVSWIPDRVGDKPDLLGTAGDYLRLWEVKGDKLEQRATLTGNKTDQNAPLTSFDWNETDLTLIGTSSIDTTVTIWNIETQQVKTQLIAHDREVYDIAFARGTDIFTSVGADGSLRLFDLRSLEHSTIIYETPEVAPLIRVAWNKQDPNYLATILMDSGKVVILDVRVPSIPAAELNGHSASVNAMGWAPHSSCHISTGGDDRQALIWDLQSMPKAIEEPILAYTAEHEINQLNWSSSQPEWIAIAFTNKLQILRV